MSHPLATSILLASVLLSLGSRADTEAVLTSMPPRDYGTSEGLQDVEEAFPELMKAFAGVDLAELAGSCRDILEESLGLLESFREHSRQHGPDIAREREQVRARARLPWIVCLVALRRMGESGDERWVELLDEIYPLWRQGAPGPRAVFIPSERVSVQGWLQRETITAYFRIMRMDALSMADFVRLYGDVLEEGNFNTVRMKALGRIFHPFYLGEKNWPDELIGLFSDPRPRVRLYMGVYIPPHVYPERARDLAIGLLADPDPEVRQRVGRRFASLRPDLAQELVPAFLRFLARDDIDEEAREAALRGLRRRGYVPVSTPDGIKAIPIEGDLPPRYMHED